MKKGTFVMSSTWRVLVALLLCGGGLARSVEAQTALNQVYLAAAVTSESQGSITLSSADSVSANDLIFVDGETMSAISCSSTTDVCSVRRGVFGRPTGHINRSIVYTGAANRFYSWSPAVGGRCVRATAYLFGYEPWVNVENGDIYACSQTYGTGSTVAGQWIKANFQEAWASPSYRAIHYPTSRTLDATPAVITPALTVQFWESLVASLTYSGPFEVFLPNPTGLPLGKRITLSDFARLNSNASTSTAGRTITIRGLFDTDTSVTLANWQQFEVQPGATTARLQGVGASTSFYVGITASSMYYWFASPW